MTTPPRTLREDVDRLVLVVRRSVAFWRRAVAVLGVAAIVTVALVAKMPPIYRSETIILYQEAIRSSDLTGAEGTSDNARRVGARLREALFSRASLEPIVTDLHLFERPGADRHDLVDAVEETRSRITFKAREGDTFAIAFDGSTPEQSQEVARRLADRIVQYAAERRAGHARTLKDFLDAERERNEATLKIKEGSFARFLAAHPEFDLPNPTEIHVARKPGTPGAPLDPNLAALENRAARIEQQLAASGRGLQSRAMGAHVPAPPPIPDSPELVAARKDLADKLLHFTDKHPDVADARKRLDAAEAAQAHARAVADAQAALGLSPVTPTSAETLDEADREVLVEQLAAMKARIASLRAARVRGAGARGAQTTSSEESVSAVASEVEFRRLQREVNEARERQRHLDEKQFKASMTASLVSDDRNIQVSVLDPAYLPSHAISRSRRLLAAGGLLVGIVLALVLALVSARLDDRLHDRADVADLGLCPVLAVIPGPPALLSNGRRDPRRGESDASDLLG